MLGVHVADERLPCAVRGIARRGLGMKNLVIDPAAGWLFDQRTVMRIPPGAIWEGPIIGLTTPRLPCRVHGTTRAA